VRNPRATKTRHSRSGCAWRIFGIDSNPVRTGTCSLRASRSRVVGSGPDRRPSFAAPRIVSGAILKTSVDGNDVSPERRRAVECPPLAASNIMGIDSSLPFLGRYP
jgi:hypothetical protein